MVMSENGVVRPLKADMEFCVTVGLHILQRLAGEQEASKTSAP